MSHHQPLPVAELVAYVERQISRARAEEIEQHLAACADCRQSLEELRDTLALVGVVEPALEEIDLLPGIHRQLAKGEDQRPRWRRRWLALTAAGAGLAAAALVVVAVLPDEAALPPEVRSKSGGGTATERWTGARIHRVTAAGAVPVGETLAADESLVFSYSNAGPQPFAFLMIFAVDDRRQVHWYYPAYAVGDDPAELSSVPIRATRTFETLAEQIRHDLPAGRLTLHALFSRQALTVSQVEARVAAGRPHESADLPLADTLQQRHHLEVRR